MNDIDVLGNFGEGYDTTLEWWQTDSHKNYLQNLTTHPQNMERWRDVEIKYDINRYAFRSAQFEENTKNIMFFGCSHAVGVGLPLEWTFAKKVADELGLELYNLAVAGGSNDFAYRLAQHWIPILKPEIVVYKTIEESRFEIKMTNNWNDGKPVWHGFLNSKDNVAVLGKNFGDYYDQWVTHESNTSLNKEKNIRAVAQICFENDISFVRQDPLYAPHVREWAQSAVKILARDQQHPGRAENQYIANDILLKIHTLDKF